MKGLLVYNKPKKIEIYGKNCVGNHIFTNMDVCKTEITRCLNLHNQEKSKTIEAECTIFLRNTNVGNLKTSKYKQERNIIMLSGG